VEGLFALNEEEAIEGLYVATTPCLRLARATASVGAAAPVGAPVAGVQQG
jgi:hypothetical protein